MWALGDFLRGDWRIISCGVLVVPVETGGKVVVISFWTETDDINFLHFSADFGRFVGISDIVFAEIALLTTQIAILVFRLVISLGLGVPTTIVRVRFGFYLLSLLLFL